MIDTPPAIVCQIPRAVDGDTIRCANLPASVRLLGIDAPELPGHCHRPRVCTPGNGQASTRQLARLLSSGPKGSVVRIIPAGHDRYGRILARVRIGRVDASCHQIATGAAVARYGPIACPVHFSVSRAGW